MSQPDIQDRLQQALGPAYVIERELGGGGMSRVFLAHEAALGRKVVIKVLRPELAEALSAERFKREVKLAARLQHPHIVPLLAAGEFGDAVLFYTMPFVEGESLRARLEREGGLPVNDTVRVLSEVAGALAYAHRLGIVHRDIKPENILLSDGNALVADFGIAKAISASRDGESESDARRSSTLTAAGTSLGTPMYMAPEQATGDVVDHRADLYALGAVGYEMLSGSPPFQGRTAQQLLAAHATETPEPIVRRRASVPPALAALIMRLLEKHPADRPQTAEEVVRRALTAAGGSEVRTADDTSAPTEATTAARPVMRRSLRSMRPALLAGLAALAGLGAGMLLGRSREPESLARAVISLLDAPPGHELRPDGGLSLSADNAKLAFAATDQNGVAAIWVRYLDSIAPVRISGTEGGLGPFWSPDGGSLGYVAGGQLRVIDLRSGAIRSLCPAPRFGGATWTRDGTIVYTPDFISLPLFRVPAAGGACTELIRFRPGESVYRRPSALPDGRILFSSGRTGQTSILAVDLASGRLTEVRRQGADPQFVPPDWMLFRETRSGALYAQRLDLRTLSLRGEPSILLERVAGVRTLPSYAASPSVLVAFQMGTGAQALVWVDRRSVVVDSVRAPTNGPPFFGAASATVSHDGTRIAFAAAGPMWLYDRSRQVGAQAHTGIILNQGILDPAWGPGDSLIAYRTLFAGTLMLRVHHVESDRSDSLFSSGLRNLRNPDWSPDGKRIAFQLSAGDSAATDEIWIYSFAERKAWRLWEAPANLWSPRWSTDGRWLAYVSDETGAPEVYLRQVSGSGGAVRVSTAGGEFPYWRKDGTELYYRAPDGAIMAVQVRLGPKLSVSSPRVVLSNPPFSRTIRSFEVTPDGERFVAFGREEPLVFTLVSDWPARVK